MTPRPSRLIRPLVSSPCFCLFLARPCSWTHAVQFSLLLSHQDLEYLWMQRLVLLLLTVIVASIAFIRLSQDIYSGEPHLVQCGVNV